ncbi:hypothetical protein [Paenibacillus ihuae]|uniref:hypothetical protein n=1 Tax=Paenibacillus ihuae TaxID=1232431 RepID=UPI0006D59F16|nr:hypothetical protein [Paenibacillus ihuae]
MNSLIHLEKKLLSLSNQLKSLSQELEKERNLSAKDQESGYDRIQMLARKYPIKNVKLRTAHESTKKAYFGLLTLLSTAAQQDLTEDQRLFLQRIAAGAGYSLDFEEWIKARKTIEEELEDGNRIPLEENTYSLLLDGLLLINLTGAATMEEWRMLAELSIVLNFAQEDLEMLAQLARSIIHQNEEEFNSVVVTDSVKWRGMFTHHIPAAWLKNNRIYCGSYEEIIDNEELQSLISKMLRIHDQLEVEYKLKEDSIVKKDDVIVKYIKNDEENSILSPRSGRVFYKELKKNITNSQKMVTTSVFIGSCFE